MLRRIILAVLLLAVGLTTLGYLAAVQAPVVERYRVALPDWPAGAPPLKLALLTDTHAAWPDMPVRRLDAIVDQVNALAPDCVLLGGDYVGHNLIEAHPLDFATVTAPFARLRPRIATIGVPGNHDLRGGDGRLMTEALRRRGVLGLRQQLARCGPLTIGGVDFLVWNNRPAIRQMTASAIAQGGPRLLLAHSPDIAALPMGAGWPLILAGHTHCGQVALPIYGAVLTATNVGRRYACGRVDDPGRTVIVSAGVGTSNLPIRLFTRPTIVVVEVGGVTDS